MPNRPNIKAPAPRDLSQLIPTRGMDPSLPLNLTVIYFGFPATGKTHCLTSWPNPLVLTCESNLATLRKHNVDYVEIPDWPTFRNTILPMLERRKWLGPEHIEVPFPYRTLAIDTISSLVDLLAAYLREKQNLDGWDFWAAMELNITRTMRQLLTIAKPAAELPSCHVITSCHLEDRFNESNRLEKTKPGIGGKSANNLPKWFDTKLMCRSAPHLDESTNPPKVTGKDYFVQTINPNRYIEFLGDGLGGGRFAELPPRTGGTYAELISAWNIPEEQLR